VMLLLLLLQMLLVDVLLLLPMMGLLMMRPGRGRRGALDNAGVTALGLRDRAMWLRDVMWSSAQARWTRRRRQSCARTRCAWIASLGPCSSRSRCVFVFVFVLVFVCVCSCGCEFVFVRVLFLVLDLSCLVCPVHTRGCALQDRREALKALESKLQTIDRTRQVWGANARLPGVEHWRAGIARAYHGSRVRRRRKRS
jgi:hypothetical protein